MAPQRSTSTPLTRRSLLVAGSAAVLIGAAGCGRQDATASSDPTGRATTAGEDDEKPTRPLTVAQTDSQLKATIDSRKKLDDHPLYSLTWEGQPAKITPPEDAAAGGVLTGFACTLFAASAPDGAALVARNFDWDPAPASVVESTLNTGRKTLSPVWQSGCEPVERSQSMTVQTLPPRDLTPAQKQDHVLAYLACRQGTKRQYLDAHGISQKQMYKWKAAVADGDLDANLIPRQTGKMTSREVAEIRKLRDEVARLEAEKAKSDAEIERMGRVTDALGKAIDAMHAHGVKSDEDEQH
jgi:transposase-like protein